MKYKNVVTSFLFKDKKVLLLRRSDKVETHKGKWSGISGYLEEGEEALQRAQIEVKEELGLSSQQINFVRVGETLRALDEQTETVWIVHPFLFETRATEFRLDWENVECKWVDPKELHSYETVPKLQETYDRVHCNQQAAPTAHADVFAGVERLAQDRVHGASALGVQAIELLSAAAEASRATDTEDLFCELLTVASRIRTAQPGMAIVRNLVESLMYQADLKRFSSLSSAEFKNEISSLAREICERSKSASEDASRNCASTLPEHGHVLTHSYSRAVLRAMELGIKGGRKLQVYATESYPGMEGRELAKALVSFGVPVRLVADSAVGSIISDVDLVLVGADSILSDGALIHKVGTRNIAAAAKERGCPMNIVCETMKFSTADLLGEPVRYSEDLFDITPSTAISALITEMGPLSPSGVEGKVRLMLKEMYP